MVRLLFAPSAPLLSSRAALMRRACAHRPTSPSRCSASTSTPAEIASTSTSPPPPPPPPPSTAVASGGRPLLQADGSPLLHVVFVHPQIHWNTGNVGRTCLGLGARLHVVEPIGFSLEAAQVRRAGLDYWEHVDLRVHASWTDFMRRLPETAHIYMYTKFGETNAATTAWQKDGRPLYLIFGSEVDGFTAIRDWLDEAKADRQRITTVAFPMVDDRFRSFNLSTTASMALWDAYKSLS